MGLVKPENQEAAKLPREKRPFHDSYFKCYICGDRFRKGDQVYFKWVPEASRTICRKCSEDEAYRMRNAEKFQEI
jgi:hypothetical protein